ncbi:hypothetical protein HID58_057345, partial [Brassica napus]
KETWTTIGERISKKKRQQKNPKYINDVDWTLLLEHWATDAAKKKSKKAAKSRKSDLVGKGCHKHNAGPRSFARIEYNMMVASGTNERPSFTNLGKRGHVYGLGSTQYREQAPSLRVPNGLARNLELEMRVGGLETSLQSVRQDMAEVKQDVSEMKQDFASTRDSINQLLQTLRPQQAHTEQTYAQPQAPTTQP